jgi:uncharacterized membrane protein
MIFLALSILAFGLLHLAPAIPAWKAALQNILGTAYGPGYGIGLLLLFAACIWAFRATPSAGDLAVLTWGRHANFLLTWIAFLFIGIFLFRGSWRARLQFPMALAILFWGTGHILANIEPKAFLLFGGMMAVALIYVVMKRQQPPSAPAEIRNGHNLLSIIFGTALYGLMAQLHEVLIGVPVVTLMK